MLKSNDTPEKNLLHCPKCNEEFPAQGRERYKQILDVIRANQEEVGILLTNISFRRLGTAKQVVADMHKHDRDAILQSGGILTSEQIELLKKET